MEQFNAPNNNYKELNAFYGNHGENLVTLKIPYIMYMGTIKITKICMNKKIADKVIRILEKTLAYYGLANIKKLGLDQYGGCLNIRLQRGSKTKWSTHSWGIAFDFDTDNNKLRMTWKEARFSKPEYIEWIKFWYEEGATNLGAEFNYDSMHFQFCIGR